MGFSQPTPIQEQSIPYLLEGGKKDFIGLAQTGTGKTAAFGLPLIELIDSNQSQVQALVLSPTRELGQQTAKQIEEFSKGIQKVNVVVVYGGAAITTQMRQLKKPTQIVVATPGRLLDLIRRRAISLDAVKQVVLDEADEMLNMGFQEDIDAILSNIRVEYSLWLFSATMPSGIRKIVKSYMKDPFEVSVKGKEETNVDISHQYVVTSNDNKLPALKRIIAGDAGMKGILFCRTKRETQQIADQLSQEGYNVEALHGDLSQAQRDVAMNKFKAQKVQLLIATDVAARGIDVSELSHVMHHKLPDQLEAYTHRSGRTGRAGNKGISLAFINNREGRKIKELEKRLKINFEQMDIPSQSQVEALSLEKWVKDLLSIEEDGKAYQFYQQVKEHFNDISKEELITKLISREMTALIPKNNKELNQSIDFKAGSGGSSRKGRGDDRGGDSISEMNRYELNIGRASGLNKREFLQFLVDMSGVNRKDVGDIFMESAKTIFELKGRGTKNFEASFKNIALEEGEKLRLKSLGKSGGRTSEGSRDSKFKGKGKGRGRSEGKGRGDYKGKSGGPGMRKRRKS